MYFISPRGEIVRETHLIDTTKRGRRIFLNPGNGWVPVAGPGERIRQDRDGNYIVSKR